MALIFHGEGTNKKKKKSKKIHWLWVDDNEEKVEDEDPKATFPELQTTAELHVPMEYPDLSVVSFF